MIVIAKSFYLFYCYTNSTPYNTRGYQGSQRSRGDNRGGGKKGSVFSRLGGPDRNRGGGGGGVFGRLSGGFDDDSSGSHNHDRGNRDTGDWNRGSRGSYYNNRRGSSRGGWQNNTDKPSFQRSDSDFMEEDHSQILLVNIDMCACLMYIIIPLYLIIPRPRIACGRDTVVVVLVS